MQKLIEGALRRPRLVLTTLILLILAGFLAYQAMPKEADPDVSLPQIYVSLTLEGVSPEDAERLLLRPMESELRSLEGLKTMKSTAYLGGAFVLLEFDAGFNPDKALDDVRTKVDLARPELPQEADEPSVHEVNFSQFPVLNIGLSGPVPERTLVSIANRLQDRIESLENVLEADIRGDRDEAVEIIVDPQKLQSYGLQVSDVAALANRSNRLVAAGTLDTGQGRFSIKVPGLYESIADIAQTPVKVKGDTVVTVQQIAADIRRTFKDPETIARTNGERSVSIQVVKRTGRNLIDTIEQVKQIVETERKFWPAQVKVTYSNDRSNDIRGMLSELVNSLVAAIILVLVVIVGALGTRSGLIAGVAIPASFLIGILALHLSGVGINIVVLFSLILATGMLVDGAIVITEYADRRMTEGVNRRDAYAEAARYMAWPVFSSIATMVAAFVPLLFWPGVVGQFMRYLPLTLTATLAASYLVAMIFTPTLGALFGRPGLTTRTEERRMKILTEGSEYALKRVGGLAGGYVKILAWVIKRPGRALLAGLAVLILAWGGYILSNPGVEFFPKVEPDEASIQVRARGNLSLSERDDIVRKVENIILTMQAERGEFSAISTVIRSRAGIRDQLPEDTIGTFGLEFTDWNKRRKAEEIVQEIRTRAGEIPGIFVEAEQRRAGPGSGKPIQLLLTSRYPEELSRAANLVANKMRSMPDLVDVEDGLPLPGIEWRVDINRVLAAKYGADVSTVGNVIQLVTRGLPIAQYRPDTADDEVDILVRYPEADRSVDQIDRLRVSTPDGGQAPIANFITRTPQPQVSILRRTDGERSLTVAANVRSDAVLVDDMVKQLNEWLPTSGIGEHVQATFKGQNEDQAESARFLMVAFLAVIFGIALILLLEFNSFYSTALVLSAIVMSTIGVMVGLMITGYPFSVVMNGIGVIAVAGIVVNNNIILIDTYDHIKHTASSAREGILRAAAQRLRPVLLTKVTTILGLLPIMFGVNIDFLSREVTVGAPSTQWWTQLSTSIVFGLLFATPLTLLLTPSALMLRANLSAWRKRRRERATEIRPEPVPAPVAVAASPANRHAAE